MIVGSKSFRGVIIAVAVAASQLGCGAHYFTFYREGVSQNQQALQDLRLGMSADQVRAAMGEGEIVRYHKLYLVDPWPSESFSLVDGTRVLLHERYRVGSPKEQL